jgi:hypothetical protein
MATAFMLVAVLCCGVFAGAAIYINLVEHPARIGTGVESALAEWAPAYRRGAMMQAPLAILGGISATAAWLSGAGAGWLVGGVLLLSVVPFTLLAINPTNKALLDPAAARDPSRVAVLLARWNQLHAVRSFLSTVAFVLFTWLVLG